MRKMTWAARLICVAMTAAVLGGVALAAGSQGSQEDPLVTLSYLNETVVPEILKQVDEKLDKLEGDLAQQGQGSAQAVFATVDLAQGKTVTLSAGSQLLLRSGTAASSAALIDVTSGAAFGGGELTANHLYLATGDGQAVTASAAATLMIQGGYTM